MQSKSIDIFLPRTAEFPNREAVFQGRRELSKLNTRIYKNKNFYKNMLVVKKIQSQKMKEAKTRPAVFIDCKFVIRGRNVKKAEDLCHLSDNLHPIFPSLPLY